MSRCPIVLSLILAGCASAPDATQELTYLCDGGRLAAVSLSGETARVRLANDAFELGRQSSQAGARYTNARAVLHIRDDEALLAVDGRELGPCQEVKPQR